MPLVNAKTNFDRFGTVITPLKVLGNVSDKQTRIQLVMRMHFMVHTNINLYVSKEHDDPLDLMLAGSAYPDEL